MSDGFVRRLFCCLFCFPEMDRKFFPIIGKIPKNFSNRWKKTGGIFQPLENYFSIIGKLVVRRWASGLCALRAEWRLESCGRGVDGQRAWRRCLGARAASLEKGIEESGFPVFHGGMETHRSMKAPCPPFLQGTPSSCQRTHGRKETDGNLFPNGWNEFVARWVA